MAFIPKSYISQNFKFCAYSGFEIAGGKEAGYYSCSISSEGENFMFRAYMAETDSKRQPDLICRFMCYSKWVLTSCLNGTKTVGYVSLRYTF